jgi:tetratricopeptide (TPR) repeat protein
LPPSFTDVRSLLEASQPRPRVTWVGYALALGTLLVLGVLMAGSSQSQQTLSTVSTLFMALCIGLIVLTNNLALRASRLEHARLQSAEELLHLRRWPQAAMLLQAMLSRPFRSMGARFQALFYFSGALARYHRFDDVIAISDYLIESLPHEEPAVHAVKLSRGMALLRQDRLFDADRVIMDLRRSAHAAESGGLALLELYRDVKTGHATDAIEMFGKRRDMIRNQLGHRAADAHVLMAQASHMLGRHAEAAAEYEAATLLAPAIELHRRYPETSALAGAYVAASPPDFDIAVQNEPGQVQQVQA